MTVHAGWLLLAAALGSPALGQKTPAPSLAQRSEPDLQLGRGNFSLPVIDYRAADGTWKRGQGIIVGRDIARNATVGIGFFKMKPKSQEGTGAPLAGKSRKVAVGLSLRF